MADPTTPLFHPSKLPTPKPRKAQQRHQRILTSTFMYKLVFFVVLMALLPLFPSETPEFMHESFLTRSWELLHLLLVGVAIAYGLFSSRNTDPDVDKEGQWKAGTESAPEFCASHILHGSAVFDEEEEVDSPRGAGALGEGKIQTWSSKYSRNEPVVMVANGSVTSGSHAAGKPLFLPVRSLRTRHQEGVFELQDAEKGSASGNRGERKDDILSSPIPWKSRSGRMEMEDETISDTDMASPPSSHNISPPDAFSGHARLQKAPPLRSSSMNRMVSRTLSPEIGTKSAEDLVKKKSFNNHKFSPPPAPPPPPPPPFTGHVHHNANFATKSFKEELKHLSRRGRGFAHSSPLTPAAARQRNSSDGSAVGRSVRTIRPRDVDGAKAEATTEETSFEQSPLVCETMQSELLQGKHAEKRNKFMNNLLVSSDDDSNGDGDGEDVAVDSSARKDATETAPSPQPPPAAETVTEKNEVDKKADEFIAKFREQIRLQRIESIKRVAGGHRSRLNSMQ